MRKVFLVGLILAMFAMPLTADDGILNKLNNILEQFRTGYSELTTGLISLKTGQEQLIAAQDEFKTAQSTLSLGLIDLRQGLGTLTTASTILNEEQIRLNSELTNLQTSFDAYATVTDKQIAGLEAVNRRQKIGFIAAGVGLGALSIVSLYIGGK